MDNSHLAQRVKGFRTKKGWSQEILAEESGISHRTVQRIENGESKPTGDTLQRLANALEINPDELIDWTIKEDNRYLVFMNLSALSFLIFPVLGILVPFIMWTSKKDKIKDVTKVGAALINFQISWNMLLVFIPVALFLFSQLGLLHNISFRTIIIATIALYLLNVCFIVLNTFRLVKRKDVKYLSLIRFLR